MKNLEFANAREYCNAHRPEDLAANTDALGLNDAWLIGTHTISHRLARRCEQDKAEELMAKISGIHHTGIVVSDMEKSKKWYQEVLGLKLVSEFDLDSEELRRGVAVPKCRLLGAMLQWGDGERAEMVELLHYPTHPARPFNRDMASNELGVRHVAFATENAIDDLYAEMAAKGAVFLSPPQELDLDGVKVKFCYLKDPDGIGLELIGT